MAQKKRQVLYLYGPKIGISIGFVLVPIMYVARTLPMGCAVYSGYNPAKKALLQGVNWVQAQKPNMRMN
jgi:hypothetical protein